jgi:tRNA nucleotidyltransferase (CCA-adding enzyme)
MIKRAEINNLIRRIKRRLSKDIKLKLVGSVRKNGSSEKDVNIEVIYETENLPDLDIPFIESGLTEIMSEDPKNQWWDYEGKTILFHFIKK